MTFSTLLKRPSGFLPVVMSCAALALVLGHIALFGTAREADEGTAAHFFQLLMVTQAPIVMIFAIRWIPKAPRQALQVIALQVGAALAALAPVFVLNL